MHNKHIAQNPEREAKNFTFMHRVFEPFETVLLLHAMESLTGSKAFDVGFRPR